MSQNSRVDNEIYSQLLGRETNHINLTKQHEEQENRSNCYPKDARGSCVFYTSDEIAFDVIGFDLQKEAGWDTSILGCTSY